MPKKPNLASVLDDLPQATQQPATPPADAPRQRRRGVPADAEGTVLVGANLPPRYAKNLALLHAETGKDKKALLKEALDMLFIAKGGALLRN